MAQKIDNDHATQSGLPLVQDLTHGAAALSAAMNAWSRPGAGSASHETREQAVLELDRIRHAAERLVDVLEPPEAKQAAHLESLREHRIKVDIQILESLSAPGAQYAVSSSSDGTLREFRRLEEALRFARLWSESSPRPEQQFEVRRRADRDLIASYRGGTRR